jgi:hypothetical protein
VLRPRWRYGGDVDTTLYLRNAGPYACFLSVRARRLYPHMILLERLSRLTYRALSGFSVGIS